MCACVCVCVCVCSCVLRHTFKCKYLYMWLAYIIIYNNIIKSIAHSELKLLYVHFVHRMYVAILCKCKVQENSKIGGVCAVLSVEEVAISLESKV